MFIYVYIVCIYIYIFKMYWTTEWHSHFDHLLNDLTTPWDDGPISAPVEPYLQMLEANLWLKKKWQILKDVCCSNLQYNFQSNTFVGRYSRMYSYQPAGCDALDSSAVWKDLWSIATAQVRAATGPCSVLRHRCHQNGHAGKGWEAVKVRLAIYDLSSAIVCSWGMLALRHCAQLVKPLTRSIWLEQWWANAPLNSSLQPTFSHFGPCSSTVDVLLEWFHAILIWKTHWALSPW